jgi:hypothetical protein
MAWRAENRPSTRRVFLNWYVNRNVRFMFNYLHGDIAKQVSATNVGDAGAKFDAFAVRTPTSHSRQNKIGYACASLLCILVEHRPHITRMAQRASARRVVMSRPSGTRYS